MSVRPSATLVVKPRLRQSGGTENEHLVATGDSSCFEDSAEGGQPLRYGPVIDPAPALLGHHQAGLSQGLEVMADGEAALMAYYGCWLDRSN